MGEENDMILTVTANAAIDKRYIVRGLQVGEVNRVQSVEMSAGGKGLNVARVAHIAGEEVLATGFLGGHSGEFIQETIKAEGVKDDFVWCDGETRSCVNIWDDDRKVQTEILEPGFAVSESKWMRCLQSLRSGSERLISRLFPEVCRRGAVRSCTGECLRLAKKPEKK